LVSGEGVSIIEADTKVIEKLGDIFDVVLLGSTPALVGMGHEESHLEEACREIGLGESTVDGSQLYGYE
jgi:hypothetical protein